MFYDEDHDYAEAEKQAMSEESIGMKTVGALFLLLLVLTIACCAATTEPFRDNYDDCIERGGNTLTCSQGYDSP